MERNLYSCLEVFGERIFKIYLELTFDVVQIILEVYALVDLQPYVCRHYGVLPEVEAGNRSHVPIGIQDTFGYLRQYVCRIYNVNSERLGSVFLVVFLPYHQLV